MTTESSPIESWWGDWALDLGEVRRWRIGPSVLWVQRLELEWRAWWDGVGGRLDGSLECAVPASVDEVPDHLQPQRFASTLAVERIFVGPRLPERIVVARPESPFTVLPEQDVQLFVSTPVFVELGLDSPEPILEFPSFVLSDTWTGASTTDGEAAYAMKTACRLRLADLVRAPHRAITPIVLRNRVDQPLLVERIAVPVPFLDVYGSSNHRIWTSTITLTRRTEEAGLASVDIGAEAPTFAEGGKLIAHARRERDDEGILHALSGLF